MLASQQTSCTQLLDSRHMPAVGMQSQNIMQQTFSVCYEFFIFRIMLTVLSRRNVCQLQVTTKPFCGALVLAHAPACLCGSWHFYSPLRVACMQVLQAGVLTKQVKGVDCRQQACHEILAAACKGFTEGFTAQMLQAML